MTTCQFALQHRSVPEDPDGPVVCSKPPVLLDEAAEHRLYVEGMKADGNR